MILTCPACEAQYLLPDDSIGANGRRVKCTSCSYTWLQGPEGPVDEVVEAKEFSFDPERVKQRQLYDPRQIITPVTTTDQWSRTLAVGAGLAGFMLVVTIGFLLLFRGYAVTTWPPIALLYESVGLAVAAPGSGLVLENVTAELDEKQGVLNLKGTITNPLKVNRKLPKFLVRLSGETGWLKDWPINLYEKTMLAGTSIGFEYSLQDPPIQGREVTLRFAD